MRELSRSSRFQRLVSLGGAVAAVLAVAATAYAGNVTPVDPAASTELLVEFDCAPSDTPQFRDPLNSYDETFAAGTEQLNYDIGDINAMGFLDTVVFVDCTPNDGETDSVECWDVVPLGQPGGGIELTTSEIADCTQFLPTPTTATLTPVDPTNSYEILVEFGCTSEQAPSIGQSNRQLSFAAGTESTIFDSEGWGRFVVECTPGDGNFDDIDCFTASFTEIAGVSQLSVKALPTEDCESVLPFTVISAVTPIDPRGSTELLVEFGCEAEQNVRFVDPLNDIDELYPPRTSQIVHDIGEFPDGVLDTIVFVDCSPADGDPSSVECFEVVPILVETDILELQAGVLPPADCDRFRNDLPQITLPNTTTEPATPAPTTSLPETGSTTGGAVGLAAVLLGSGVGLVALARRHVGARPI